MQLDSDYSLAKECAAHVCYIKRKVAELLDRQQLIHKASNMYM